MTLPTRGALWPLFVLSATFAAGYGVLFTLIGDYRDEYGLSETTLGLVTEEGAVYSSVRFLENGTRVEFGSDYEFLDGRDPNDDDIPAPGTTAILGLAGLMAARRRR